MAWKTYLIMYFGTEGNSNMTEVVGKVESLGFKCTFGPTDFIYEWDEEPKKEEICKLGDRLQETLRGSNSTFNLDTHD